MIENQKLEATLLYVEDEASTREKVTNVLRRRVRTVLTAADGLEGLKIFKDSGPDIVITDIRMPAMNGLEMAKAIKDTNDKTRIIITTAFDDISYMLEAIELGVDRYVLKPISTDKLVSAVEKCFDVIFLQRKVKQQDEEKESLIIELRDALANIKTLQGLLPICAACKKIRDDRGAWKHMETYISEHSEAEFSHGICPECAAKLYPKYFPHQK